MISRTQRILFWTLLVSSVVMAVVLLRMRERAMDRLLASAGSMPLNPSAGRPLQSVTMMIANDMDGSLHPATQNLALPVDGNARAHVILQHLILELRAAQQQAPDRGQQRRERDFLHDPAAGAQSGHPRHRSHCRPERIVCRRPPFRH